MNCLEEIEKYGLTPEQYEECLNLIADKKNKANDIDWSEICTMFNLPYSNVTLRKANDTIFGGAFVRQYEKEKKNIVDTNIPINDRKETRMNKDGSWTSNMLLSMTEEQSKDSDYILKAHGFDTDKWQITSLRNSVRQVISKQDGVITLYASYLTVKPVSENELSLSKIEEFFDNLDRNYSLPKLNIEQSVNYDGDSMLLIDIADLHMNLQASLFTTGNEYNCDIAEKLFFHVIEDILRRTKIYKFKEIVFCVGGDMLNGDNLSGSTTKGTAQDSDIHFYDAYERLCAMTIKAIDILKDISIVKVIYVMGNHDEVTGFKLAKYIDAWFRNEDRVEVDYKPLARKYVLFGKTLLCFAHDGNVKKLPMIIADEAREYWSKAETTEVFLQHLHTEQVLMEENNMRIQRLPTISGRSKWSSDKGYGSKRQCKAFVFDYMDGLRDVLYTPIRQGKEV